MPEIKLTAEEMRYIALFQDLTRATVRDCIIDNDENRIIFLVKPGDMGLAIGRNGINIKSCLLYTSPSPRDISGSRMPSSA